MKVSKEFTAQEQVSVLGVLSESEENLKIYLKEIFHGWKHESSLDIEGYQLENGNITY